MTECEAQMKSDFYVWYPQKDASGREYYCNRDTGEAMWEHPAHVVLPAHYMKTKAIERLRNQVYVEHLRALSAQSS